MQGGREGEEANNTINTGSNVSSKAPAINNKSNDKNEISREATLRKNLYLLMGVTEVKQGYSKYCMINGPSMFCWMR